MSQSSDRRLRRLAPIAKAWDACHPPSRFEVLIDPWQNALVRFATAAETESDPERAWRMASPHMRWSNQSEAMHAALTRFHARSGEIHLTPSDE